MLRLKPTNEIDHWLTAGVTNKGVNILYRVRISNVTIRVKRDDVLDFLYKTDALQQMYFGLISAAKQWSKISTLAPIKCEWQ